MKPMIICFVSFFWIGCSNSETRREVNLCQLDGPKRSAIFERVSNGSVDDLKKVVMSLPCLDGGDLEDAHIAIGIGLFRHQEQFSAQLRSSSIGMNDLQSISTMLPASFVDEPCLAADELSRRKKIAHQAGELGDWRQPILAAIEESLQSERERCLIKTKGPPFRRPGQ
jgi:hypothetical protein